MNTAQTYTVFEDADLIRDGITMLCRDRLPKVAAEDKFVFQEQKSAIDNLCWNLFSLQGRNFPRQVLLEKVFSVVARSAYAPIRTLKAEEVLNEISSPYGGW
ncbi:MAG TPA: hypothetical protein VGL56_07740 [Fimbriimonadaceae bacterium]|jgi:hypothetical protein